MEVELGKWEEDMWKRSGKGGGEEEVDRIKGGEVVGREDGRAAKEQWGKKNDH